LLFWLVSDPFQGGALLRLRLLGAGTLARFVVDMVAAMPGVYIDGVYDDCYPDVGPIKGAACLGRLEDLKRETGGQVVLAVGDPRFRKRHYEDLVALGFEFPALVHPSCIASAEAVIHPGVLVGPFGLVLAGSEIQAGSCLLSRVTVNQDVHIGAFNLIGAGAMFGNGAATEEGCHIGMSAVVRPAQRVPAWSDIQ
jgi:UDP-3-O-[3-hydroxymyristoyl] glucosamine N-acyltransferase